ncbi:hypothetical protein, partial [Verrucomicrobium spinosum]|uniref:hypothetical protein n=1 Tax=Verrucomicrobium spinosum TaxID=2736 RepID=UPI000A759809
VSGQWSVVSASVRQCVSASVRQCVARSVGKVLGVVRWEDVVLACGGPCLVLGAVGTGMRQAFWMPEASQPLAGRLKERSD